ncbi:MAG: 3-oxoacyl-ACP reductase FabG [Nitrospinae bacterium]|nr:3-oxoacyl-ACP reductase FabG [Nitrospinota bacterium]
MKFDFNNQTAIVTGGTRGIGRAISEAFLAAGAKVIAVFRSNDQAAESFKESCAEFRGKLTVKKFDVGNYNEVEEFFRRLETDFADGFEILVNNAGIRKDSILGMMAKEDWNKVIDANLTGAFNMCKLAVQSLAPKRYGRIITITSPIGKIGFAGQANYAASKAGQVALTRSLAKEVASRKITVNCVSPGFIDTEFIADLPEEQKKRYLEMIPMKRLGTADEVAQAVLFLADRNSTYITGAVLEITGGL